MSDSDSAPEQSTTTQLTALDTHHRTQSSALKQARRAQNDRNITQQSDKRQKLTLTTLSLDILAQAEEEASVVPAAIEILPTHIRIKERKKVILKDGFKIVSLAVKAEKTAPLKRFVKRQLTMSSVRRGGSGFACVDRSATSAFTRTL